MKMVQDIIIKPIITEASMDNLADKKYTFKVASDATKPEIAYAVETMFGVKVESVNTISMKKKPKTEARHKAFSAHIFSILSLYFKVIFHSGRHISRGKIILFFNRP